MLLIETTTEKSAMTRKLFGPGYTELEAAAAASMEIWGSSFGDPGPDFCVFILKDEAGQEIDRRRVPGY